EVIISSDVVAELRVLVAAHLRALQADGAVRPRLPRPGAGQARPRLAGGAVPLPRRALAPRTRHGRRRVRHVPRAHDAPLRRRRRAVVPAGSAAASRGVLCVVFGCARASCSCSSAWRWRDGGGL
ncbi:hypothetical protein EE612_030694, partial [Oryza sativa]